jgi:hypothetical protein
MFLRYFYLFYFFFSVILVRSRVCVFANILETRYTLTSRGCTNGQIVITVSFLFVVPGTLKTLRAVRTPGVRDYTRKCAQKCCCVQHGRISYTCCAHDFRLHFKRITNAYTRRCRHVEHNSLNNSTRTRPQYDKEFVSDEHREHL